MASGHEGWSQSQEHALTGINIASSSISMLGSGFIVISMLVLSYKSYKEDPSKIYLLQLLHFRLVFLLSMSDIMYSMAMLFGDPEDGSDLCYSQAILASFFGLTSVGWVLCIAYTLWANFVGKSEVTAVGDTLENERALLLRMWGANWLFALFWTCIPLADGNHYGSSGAWCWIDDTDTGQVMRYFSFYLWLWVAIGLILFFYYQLMIAIYDLIEEAKEDDEAIEGTSSSEGCCTKLCAVIKVLTRGVSEQDVSRGEMIRIMQQLCLYPMILIGCWTFGTINRLQNSFAPDDPSFGLFVVHMLTSNLNGFFNAFAYGYNTTFRRDVKKYCCGWIDESEQHVQAEDDNGPSKKDEPTYVVTVNETSATRA